LTPKRHALHMSVAELEKAVSVLSPEELRKFRSWFAKFDADQWDRQIEQDSNEGKLDHLIENALKDHRVGRTREL
jgi:hypothetical protein